MSALAALVLAQVVNLGLRDRTEARRVVLNDQHYEAESTPGALLTFHWPRYDLSLNYGVSLLELPLESSSRHLLVYHTVVFDTAYRFKHTKLSLNSRSSFGELNFLVAALANPTTIPQTNTGNTDTNTNPNTNPNTGTTQPGGTPTQPGMMGDTTAKPATPTEPLQQTRTVNRAVRYGTTTNTLQLTHLVSRELSVGTSASYTIAGGLDDSARVDYPLIRGATAGVQATHVWLLTGSDSFVLDATGQHAWSSNGNLVTSLLATDNWRHAFDKHTGSIGGVGISVVRFARFDGLIAYSIFPTFQAGVAHTRLVSHGNLNLQATVFSRPALDPLRATVDPRLGGSLSAGWIGKHFSTSVTGDAAVSIAPSVNNAGAFDAFRGTFLMAYRFNDYFSADTGVRFAQQTFQSTNTIPFNYTVFAALTFGYLQSLSGHQK